MVDASQLDLALSRLGENASTHTRTEALKALVEYWHGPITDADGFPQSELDHLPMPQSLRWWFSWAGRRLEITRGQDRLFQPSETKLVNGGRLVEFWIENQGVYTRATLPSGEDPLMFQSDWSHEGCWKQEEMSVLEFLIEVCVSEAITHATYRGFLDVDEAHLQRFNQLIPKLPIPSWRQWPPDDERPYVDFYAGRGFLAQAWDLGCSPAGIRGYTLWVAGKSPEAFFLLEGVIRPEQWEDRTF
jgi:hypothetical protein